MLFLFVIAIIVGFSVWYWILRDDKDISNADAEIINCEEVE